MFRILVYTISSILTFHTERSQGRVSTNYTSYPLPAYDDQYRVHKGFYCIKKVNYKCTLDPLAHLN